MPTVVRVLDAADATLAWMIDLREGVSPALLPAIEAVVASQQTLEDVVRWGLSQEPPRLIERVVVQDEYTHDVVLGFSEGAYLVYDTT
jgi:hypothetical protein